MLYTVDGVYFFCKFLSWLTRLVKMLAQYKNQLCNADNFTTAFSLLIEKPNENNNINWTPVIITPPARHSYWKIGMVKTMHNIANLFDFWGRKAARKNIFGSKVEKEELLHPVCRGIFICSLTHLIFQARLLVIKGIILFHNKHGAHGREESGMPFRTLAGKSWLREQYSLE